MFKLLQFGSASSMRRLVQYGLIALWVVAPIALAVEVNIGTVVTWLGGGTSGASHGTGSGASFSYVFRVAEHPTTHDLYIVEQNNNVVRKVPFGTSTTQNWLGTLGSGPGSSLGAGTAASLNSPDDCIITADGATMYLTDSNNHFLRKVNIADASNSAFAGGVGLAGSDDATGTAAKFDRPWGITMRGTTEMFVTEWNGKRVRKVTVPAAVVTTVVGSAGFGFNDGSSAVAQFGTPAGIAHHAGDDVLYVVDYWNNRIRKSSRP